MGLARTTSVIVNKQTNKRETKRQLCCEWGWDTYLCERELKDVWVVDLFEVFLLPGRRRILANGLLLGELDIVEHPVRGHLGDVREEDCDRAFYINIACAEIKLILSLVIA